jgi:hypothetical protein
MQTRFAIENHMTPMWQTALNVNKILRSQFGRKYDRSEARNIWVRTRLRKNNTSGIPGVARYEVLANPNTGRRAAFWLAFWVDEHGASRKRKFYVTLRGERQAKRLAIAERERQLSRVCAIAGRRPKVSRGGTARLLQQRGRR